MLAAIYLRSDERPIPSSSVSIMEYFSKAFFASTLYQSEAAAPHIHL